MHTITDHLKRDIGAACSVGHMVDAAHGAARQSGFDALIYDFSPVATTPEGDLVIPSHLSHRNAPQDMRHLWCDRQYHRHDPVQQIALRRNAPFVWSYRNRGQGSALAGRLEGQHDAVCTYLHDTGMTCGITVPLHRAMGGFATFTVIQKDAGASFTKEAGDMLQAVAMIGQIMHDTALPHLEATGATTPTLTRREAQCLRYAAQGCTAKEVAGLIRRSVPTATLHLKSATTKLGARNRSHAVALAMHYRLIRL